MKKSNVLIVTMILALLCGCSRNNEENQVDKYAEANLLLRDATQKLQAKDQVNMYSYVDIFHDGHSEWKNETKNGENVLDENGLEVIKRYRSWYTSIYTVVNMNNVNNQKTYINTFEDYTDVGTSEGNKFIDVTMDDNYSFGMENEGTEYELNLENIKKVHMPYYETIKKGDIYEGKKLIVKDNKATVYVDGKLKEENMDIPEDTNNQQVSGFPPIDSHYSKGPLENFLAELDDRPFYFPTSFMTFGGFTFADLNTCNVSIDRKDKSTTITYIYDKKLEVKSENKENYTPTGVVPYIDEGTNLVIEIDKEGCLKKVEISKITGHLNKGIEDFKIPNYAIVEFQY